MLILAWDQHHHEVGDQNQAQERGNDSRSAPGADQTVGYASSTGKHASNSGTANASVPTSPNQNEIVPFMVPALRQQLAFAVTAGVGG